MAVSRTPCTLTLDDGTHYDLSSLASATSDYTATIGDRVYKLNVCRSVVGELWNVADPDLVGGYTTRKSGDFSLGQWNDTLFLSESTQQPMMYMKLGSACPSHPLTAAATAVRFVCSPNDFNAGNPVLVAALPPGDPDNHCQFFFEWHTHVACPTNPKAELERAHLYIAFGAILLIAIMTWFFGHTFYNRFYLKRRGLDQFPLPSTLPSFPSLKLPSLPKLFGKKDAPKPANGFGWRRSQRTRGGYSHIRAEEDDEEEGFAGRFSLEDDEDEEEPRDLSPRAIRDGILNGEVDAWRSGAPASIGGAGGASDAEAAGGKGKGPATGSNGLVDI